MKIAVVHGNDGSYPRIVKTCQSLVKLGHSVHFIGWDRRRQPASETRLEGVESHVMCLPTSYARSTPWGQLRFSMHSLRCLAKIRPDCVCAANEENALRVLPYRKLLYRRLVCDVVDGQRDVGSARPFLKRCAVFLGTELARVGADTLIATDAKRFEYFGRHKPKTKIIGNFPNDPGDELWNITPSGPIKLYVSGSLAESRGVRQLLAAVDRIDNACIVAAGFPSDQFSKDTFINHPKVSWHGYVPLAKSLRLAAECDATFAFYEPNCRNNILASPTKLYEAMSVGRPVIMNSEALVSQWVLDNSLGFVCPYDDSERLCRAIRNLEDKRGLIKESAALARQLFLGQFSWERMELVLREIYGGDEIAINRPVERRVA